MTKTRRGPLWASGPGAEYFFIEQDRTYGRDPMDCIKDSRDYIRSIGY